jgi:vacuolar-type H+-ATPase subunit H
MAETIESFVARLQADGVEAGKQQAQSIVVQAQSKAKETLDQANKQAEKIVADAKARAEELLARGRTDLELASRDAALRLQQAVSRGLNALLGQAVKKHLDDPGFMGKLLHEIVMLYVKSDFECKETLRLNVPAEMREKLVQWALSEIGKEKVDEVRPSIDLMGTLADAGFEYTCHGSTVEVTRDSIVSALSDLVGPDLRETLAKAMKAPEAAKD